MTLAQTFVLTLSGEVAGPDTRNVFTYRVNEVFPSVEDVFPELLNAFEEHFFDGLDGALNSDMFHTAMSWNNLSVYSLGDPSPFLDRSISYNGLHSTSDLMPPFVAYWHRSEKKSRGIRRGQKRFAGVPELAAATGNLAANFLADSQALALKLGDTISQAAAPAYTFTPVVVGRVQYITPGGTIAYRFPESEAEFSDFTAVQWEAMPRVTSQNSRKVGAGI